MPDDARFVLRGEQAVAQLGGDAGRLATAGRHRDQRQLVGEVEDPGVPQPQVLPLVGLIAPAPEQPDDLQGFGEHFVPGLDRVGEAGADDVFVEPLPRADAQDEAALREQGEGRRRLSDDGGVVAHGGAGHPGRQTDPRRPGRDASQHRPGER